MTTTTATQSPEITGVWECKTPDCGNKTNFVGIDAHGYGGPDECENPGDCPNRGAMTADCCGCETELVQPFSVMYGEGGSWEQGDLDYERYEGGGDDSEIGEYTKIVCADCGHTLWKEGAANV
jgi:ribosomal protein S27E